MNTCAFIEAAKKESIDAILEAAEVKKRGFGKRLVVAGCLSQRYATELAATMPEVDVFVGTGNFLDLPELLRRTEAPESRPIPYAGAAHLLPTVGDPANQDRRFLHLLLEDFRRLQSQVRLLHYSEDSRPA